jgi:hypothetical protein
MNERIRQLAEQADAYARSEYEKWTPTPDFSGIPHIRKIFNEKFAELIVAEMLQTCEDHPGWSGRMIGEQIKQDFGVEE